MKPFWKQLEGVSLAGYQLGEVLGSDDSGALFLTAAGDERAVIKIIPDDPGNSERQLADWRKAASLAHPNLLRLMDCGRAEAEGVALLYAVLEYPDDCAAAVLESGQMTEPQAREALSAAVAALQAVHGGGMVHGAVDPEHLVAVGDRIKLTSDTLTEPSPEHSPATDLRGLGAAIYELLTRRRPESAPDLSGISEPLRSAIELCLEGNASARQVRETLEPPPKPASPPVAAAHPVAAPPPAPPPVVRKRLPAWAYLATVVVLLAGVYTVTRKSAPRPAVSTPTGKVEHVPQIPAAPERAERRGRAWRVVAFTYMRRKDAEARVRRLNQRWPQFHSAVFTPRGADRAPYLVTVGGRMSQAEAVRLRKKARAKGLPRDTFIREYSE